MKPKQKRVVLHVVPQFGPRGWQIVLAKTVVRACHTKLGAILSARWQARGLWRDSQCPAQVVVHGRDGRIQYEWTYGYDPEETPG